MDSKTSADHEADVEMIVGMLAQNAQSDLDHAREAAAEAMTGDFQLSYSLVQDVWEAEGMLTAVFDIRRRAEHKKEAGTSDRPYAQAVLAVNQQFVDDAVMNAGVSRSTNGVSNAADAARFDGRQKALRYFGIVTSARRALGIEDD